MYKKLTNLNISDIDENAVVLIHSDNCPDCALAMKHYPSQYDNATLYMVDFEIEEELCDSWEVFRVPSLLFLKNGKVKGNLWGLQEPISCKGFVNIHLERNK